MSIIKLSSDALTTAVAGQVEYDGKVFYGTPQSTERGIIPGQQYYRLLNALAGANVTTAQSTFGVGVNLSASTVYEFEANIMLSKTAGATSHTVGFGFGGTATLNNINYQVNGLGSTSATLSISSASYTSGYIATASNTTTSAAVASATVNWWFLLKGTVSVNAAGSFIPQYTLSAAPGGAYSTVSGSYFKINPLGASGSNISVGTWA